MKILVALVGFAVGGAAGAQAPSATVLAAKVDAHYNHLHSLTASFTERYRGMGIDRTEMGDADAEQAGADALGV